MIMKKKKEGENETCAKTWREIYREMKKKVLKKSKIIFSKTNFIMWKVGVNSLILWVQFLRGKKKTGGLWNGRKGFCRWNMIWIMCNTIWTLHGHYYSTRARITSGPSWFCPETYSTDAKVLNINYSSVFRQGREFLSGSVWLWMWLKMYRMIIKRQRM